jgi:hypothetical protein
MKIMKNNAFRSIRHLMFAGAAACLSLGAAVAQAQVPYVNATVEGQLQPGIYGRIDIGNAPPPPLIYAQPVIIQRPAVLVQQQPLYLHVPPGHAKKWSKHCGKYNACGQPVYFVKVRGDDDYERRNYQSRGDYRADRGEYRRDDYDGDSKHSGKGKEKHKNKGNKHDD